MSVLFRPLTPEDAAQYWALRLEALESYPLAFGMSAQEHRQTTHESAAERLVDAGQGNFVMGAFNVGGLRGMAGFVRHERIKLRHKGSVWGVYVGPELRGRGVGRQLLLRLIERVRGDPGLELLQLSVSSQQAAAKSLYRSLGFEVFGTERGALKVDGQLVDEDHMVLRLHPAEE